MSTTITTTIERYTDDNVEILAEGVTTSENAREAAYELPCNPAVVGTGDGDSGRHQLVHGEERWTTVTVEFADGTSGLATTSVTNRWR